MCEFCCLSRTADASSRVALQGKRQQAQLEVCHCPVVVLMHASLHVRSLKDVPPFHMRAAPFGAHAMPEAREYVVTGVIV
jgi:hypothetical protein